MNREKEKAAGTVRQAIAAPAKWPRDGIESHGGRNWRRGGSFGGLVRRETDGDETRGANLPASASLNITRELNAGISRA